MLILTSDSAKFKTGGGKYYTSTAVTMFGVRPALVFYTGAYVSYDRYARRWAIEIQERGVWPYRKFHWNLKKINKFLEKHSLVEDVR